MTDDDLLALVDVLAARGVTLQARGQRALGVSPKSAYAELESHERVALKKHRARIVELLQQRPAAAAPPPSPPQRETPKPAPSEPCRYCYQTPCIGPDHEFYRTLHANDPVEARRRDEEATREMLATLGRPHPWQDM